VRQQAEAIELETRNFYRSALTRASDAEVRKLIGDLIVAEDRHLGIAQHISEVELTPGARSAEEQAARRAFVLQYVQPGLTGLIDGSVSTLAPIFAAAFATHNTWQTFLVGLAASVGAGISMAFAEALADDGQISGRGNPWIRGAVTGLMTALGGLGHTLPYLISNFWTATSIAIAVVFVELWIIAGIRARFMETRFLRAALEVVVGGLLVFVVGILIGSA
jgi:rubrerythrin